MYKLFLLLLLLGCTPKIKGPNYNVGRSHNQNLGLRHRVVNKEDWRMKKAMIKHRQKYERGIKAQAKMRTRKTKKIIN